MVKGIFVSHELWKQSDLSYCLEAPWTDLGYCLEPSKKQKQKNKGDIFLLEEQHENFVTAVTKWELLAATNARWKWAAVKKKVNEKTNDISSIKLVTKSKKFLEVSLCGRAKQRQRNVQKKCAARAKLLFC